MTVQKHGSPHGLRGESAKENMALRNVLPLVLRQSRSATISLRVYLFVRSLSRLRPAAGTSVPLEVRQEIHQACDPLKQ